MTKGVRSGALLLAFGGASLGGASCSETHSPVPGSDAGATGASTVFVADSPEARARVDELRARFVMPAAPSAKRRQALGAGVAARFERTGDGHIKPLVSGKNAALTPASVAIAERASGDVQLEDDRTHVAVQFRLRGASDAPVSVSGGLALYSGALDGHDVVHRPRADGTEDFVVFETRPAVEELAYDVGVSRAAGLRLVSNTLEFLDASGAPRLRVAPPYVVDSAGGRSAATLSVTGCADDTDAAGPWGRPVTAPGAASCTVHVAWHSDVYPAMVDPAWTTTGSTSVYRNGHSATLLNSGKVLVVGGCMYCGTAELYDGSSSFAATGSVTTLREGFTTTLLASGKVLLAGGWSIGLGKRVATAELFDGVSKFTVTGSMTTSREYHTATLLPSGKVLMTGGASDTLGVNATAELFDGTSTFAPTGSMGTIRENHTAVLLASGKVLVMAGDTGSPDILLSAELFNGTTSFSPTGSMTQKRGGFTATLLPSGKVLVAGGAPPLQNAVATAELYDGVSAFAGTGSMTTTRRNAEAVLLSTGKVLLSGGQDASGFALSSAEVFDGTSAFGAVGSMTTTRDGHTLTLLPSKKVLAVGGDADIGVSTAELFGVAAGGACASASECISGVCDDGICCTAACNGTCQTCTAGTGACVSVKNAPDPDTCTGTQTCDATGACKLLDGQPSGSAASCLSGVVADGVCCNTACASACDACSTAAGASVNGTCAPVAQGSPGSPACGTGYVCDGTHVTCPTPCVGDIDCAAGYFCSANGVCTAQKAQGAACNVAAAADCKVAGCRACATGNCVDGVCCDTACTAVCYACAASLKESGPDGTCGPVAFEKPPPRSSCPTSGPNSCGPDGMCNGAGACTWFAPPGASCGTTTCSAGAVSGAICNGSGACTQGASANCAPFACNGNACGTSCTTDAACAGTAFCNEAGACVPKSANGAACGASDQCASGFCVDGFCCGSACTGQCEACDVAGAQGTCTAIGGAPHGSRAPCGSDGTMCGGACDGMTRAACIYHDGTPCGTSCADGKQTDKVCTTSGKCAGAPTACPDNIATCDGTACKSACTADGDCAQGFACASGKCLPLTTATCDGSHTVKAPNGTTTDCSPYDCEGDHCKATCASINDCSPGNVCDVGGHCVAQPPDAGAPSGCAVSRTPGDGSSSSFAGTILFALGLVRRVSRKRNGASNPKG